MALAVVMSGFVWAQSAPVNKAIVIGSFISHPLDEFSAIMARFPARSVYCIMLRLALTFAFVLPAAAQIFPGLTLPPSGNNQKASVTQYIGPVRINIDYSSPAVHGPDGKDRRGQI